MRNYGTHSTAKAGFRCMNNELIEAMMHDLEGHWPELEPALARSSDTLQTAMDRAIAGLKKKMEGESSSSQSNPHY